MRLETDGLDPYVEASRDRRGQRKRRYPGHEGRSHCPDLEHVHPAYAVPDRAIVLAGAIIVVVVLLGTLKSIVAAASFTILAYYTITNFAALRMPTEKKLYPNWIPALGLASCVVLAASQRPITITTGLVLLAVGFGLRMLVRRFDGGAPTLDRP